MKKEKDITIYDIAKHLKVSAATVSRGLQDSPLIAKNTREKIMETARALGYQSNSFASNLRSRQTKTLGVIVPRLNSYFMSAVLGGMERAASQHGYNLIIAQSLEDADKEKQNVNIMFNKRVDGLLISLSYGTRDTSHLDMFVKRKVPIVFFDRVEEGMDAPSIVIDNRRAAYLVTEHLAHQGCERIMHLGGPVLRNVYKQRLEGYREALKDHQLPVLKKLHLTGSLTEEAGIEAARYILSLPLKDRPDGLFAANDTAAAFCMRTLQEGGVAIPRDLAVAGFNNDPISRVMEPALTTVEYPGNTMGHTAVTNLIHHLQGGADFFKTNLTTLGSNLIVRASSLKKNA